MKSKRSLLIPLILLVAAAVLVSGCTASAKTLEGEERDAVLAYSEPAADNLFAGMNANDYAAFSADFDEKIKESLNEAALGDIQTKVIGKVGKYVSREVQSVESTDKLITVVYKAKFEQDDNVTVRLVFNNDENYLISGLWFNSAKLQGK